ncbi:MAG: molybdopterin-containing oxidoreductase family protein [Planctomycetota bacterium]|jgi:anaerobic selenocysteine-containing dehydrogenase
MRRDSVVSTYCRLCYSHCAIKLHIENGCAVNVEGNRENERSRGHVCVKGRALPEILNSPDRLRHPLRKDGNKYRKISWKEALSEITEKLAAIKDAGTPEALVCHIGEPTGPLLIRPLIERFCNVFGTPNLSSNGAQCHWAREIADNLTYGFYPHPDYEKSDCIVLWGYNPAASEPLVANRIYERQKAGAKLIIIDPFRTGMADRADLHLPVRPGADGALALAVLHVIINAGLYDRAFAGKWVKGFDEMKQLVAAYTPQHVEKITGVPAALIMETVTCITANRPCCIVQGNALEHHSNAVQTIRAIAALQAIIGSLDIEGGVYSKRSLPLRRINIREALPPDKIPLGEGAYPLFHELSPGTHANTLARQMVSGKPYPIMAMIVTAGNPALTFPNSGNVSCALEKLDFLVVMDMFMTETAKHADVVLPAAVLFERLEFAEIEEPLGDFKLILFDRLLEAPGECKSDWEFWLELADTVGLKQQFPLTTVEGLLDFMLLPSKTTIASLRQTGGAVKTGERIYRKHENIAFATPSGKVELYSERLAEMGFDPLPSYSEPDESPLSRPDTAADYPLILTTGARSVEYMHSRFHNIGSLRKRNPEPFLEIHPDSTTGLGIADGETLSLVTERGNIRIRARLTDRTRPDVVSIPHGWEEVNANILTDDAALDPISGFPPLRSILCRIEKINT